MFNLSALREWGSLIAAVVFLGLWQLAEYRERYALDIAAAMVSTNRQCMVGYWKAEILLGTAARQLAALRAQ